MCCGPVGKCNQASSGRIDPRFQNQNGLRNIYRNNALANNTSIYSLSPEQQKALAANSYQPLFS